MATASKTPTNYVDPLIGKVLGGRFKILSLVDRGGMGKIFKAEQQPLGRVVAVKTLDVIDSTGEFKKRFFLEASTCAKLSHPHTVRVFDYGATDDESVYYLVMEFLEGGQLSQLIHDRAPLDPLQAIRIARQIASALSEAHDQGLVHRDLKPQNVFLTRHGDDEEFVKVVDFGLVKELGLDSEVSRSGNVLGSPMYMAPEQVEGRAVDQRTDIYALGLILYYMLSGQTPFKRGDSLTIMMQQVHKEPPPFHELGLPEDRKVPANLEWIVRTAIKKRLEDRFATMRELNRALKAVERQIREGSSAEPFELVDGLLDPGLGTEPTEEAPRAPKPKRERPPVADDSSASFVRSMVRPAPIAAGVLIASSLAAAGIFLALGLAIGVAGWSGQFAEPAVEEAAEIPVTPPPAISSPPPPVVEAPAVVKVALHSTPEGASVYEGEISLGQTPLDLDVTTPRSLELRSDGRAHTAVVLDGTLATVQVALSAPFEERAPSEPKVVKDPPKTPKEPVKDVAPPVETPPPVDNKPRKVDEVRNPFGK